MSEAALPYGGASDPNSGFSGSDTSEARAREADRSGLTGRRQQQVLQALQSVRERGLTWRELADMLNIHHGAASAALSNLHKVKRIARLQGARNRCKVYVALEYINGRPTEPARQNKRDPYFEAVLPVLGRMTCPVHGEHHDAWCSICQQVELVFRTIRQYQREVQSQ